MPNVATTDTNVPGQVAAVDAALDASAALELNELQFQFSSNRICTTRTTAATGNLRAPLGAQHPEVFPGNDRRRACRSSPSPAAVADRRQPAVQHRVQQLHDHRQLHAGSAARTRFKVGGLMTFEQKNENATNNTQGNFTFGAGGGRTAFQNFLTGNADGLCGNACTYTEAQIDVTDAPALQPLRDVRAGLVAAARRT